MRDSAQRLRRRSSRQRTRVVAAIVVGVLVYRATHDFPDYDNCRKVGGTGC